MTTKRTEGVTEPQWQLLFSEKSSCFWFFHRGCGGSRLDRCRWRPASNLGFTAQFLITPSNTRLLPLRDLELE